MRGMSMIRAEAPPFGFDEGDEMGMEDVDVEAMQVDVRVVQQGGWEMKEGMGMGMGLVEEEGDVFE